MSGNVSFIGYFERVCPTCGEVFRPLAGFEPKMTPTENGGYVIEGTPVYCACTRPAQPEGLEGP